MRWIELDEFDDIQFKAFPYTDILDIDAWYNYWMDVADPRGKYLTEREDYLMSGGNYY